MERRHQYAFVHVEGVQQGLEIAAPAGDHIGAIYSDASRYSLYVLIALVVLLAAYIALRLWRRAKRADHRAGEPAEKADSRPGR